MKEFKKYQLKGSTRPSYSPLLSTTVAVHNEQGEAGYCYVTFSQDFVEAVGKSMQYGLNCVHPAILHVVFRDTGKWHVYARYVGGETQEVLLWKTDAPPGWLKFHKAKVQNGNNAAKSPATKSGNNSDRRGRGAPGHYSTTQARATAQERGQA